MGRFVTELLRLIDEADSVDTKRRVTEVLGTVTDAVGPLVCCTLGPCGDTNLYADCAIHGRYSQAIARILYEQFRFGLVLF